MELLRPKNINVVPGTIILTGTSTFEFTDMVHKIPMTKSVTTISMAPMGSHLNFTNRPTDDQLQNFGGMQALIKSCVDNAEDIKDRIHQIIQNRVRPKTEEERVEQMKMDLMAIKKWFMDEIRISKIHKDFSVFNSGPKLKIFSKAFNDFILDRNKYTHGQLCFFAPSYEYAIDYIETPSQRKRYATLDFKILQSYNSCYKEILKVINEYNVILQNRRTILDNSTKP